MKRRERAPFLPTKWGHRGGTIHEPGRESSPGTESAGTLILDFPPPELWDINVCWLSPLSLVLCYGSPADSNTVFFPREVFEASPCPEPQLSRPRTGDFPDLTTSPRVRISKHAWWSLSPFLPPDSSLFSRCHILCILHALHTCCHSSASHLTCWLQEKDR